VQASSAAKAQAQAAKEQAAKAAAALQAKKPSEDTEAKIKIAAKDKELKRGKGSLAKRNRAAAVGGLPGQSAASVGGL
jgi:polyribonucleotide nucleotidyltransferase